MKSAQTLVDRYTAAATAADREALLALYAPEMRMFDLMLPWQVRGTEEWAPRVDNWFSGIGTQAEAVASEIEVKETAKMAVLTMNMTYAHVSSGGERFSMTNRLTWVAVPEGDDWKIMHEHTSVPIREDDMTPQFEP